MTALPTLNLLLLLFTGLISQTRKLALVHVKINHVRTQVKLSFTLQFFNFVFFFPAL